MKPSNYFLYIPSIWKPEKGKKASSEAMSGSESVLFEGNLKLYFLHWVLILPGTENSLPALPLYESSLYK